MGITRLGGGTVERGERAQLCAESRDDATHLASLGELSPTRPAKGPPVPHGGPEACSP